MTVWSSHLAEFVPKFDSIVMIYNDSATVSKFTDPNCLLTISKFIPSRLSGIRQQASRRCLRLSNSFIMNSMKYANLSALGSSVFLMEMGHSQF